MKVYHTPPVSLTIEVSLQVQYVTVCDSQVQSYPYKHVLDTNVRRFVEVASSSSSRLNH